MSTVVTELLTVIFTTSPTLSSPSTELLSSVIASFHEHCQDLLQCRVIIVFDTYDHITKTPKLKRAQVTPEIAQNYDLYKETVKKLIIDEYDSPSRPDALTQSSCFAEFGSPGCADNVVTIVISQTSNGGVAFLEPTRCLGFSLAVRSALRICRTPYVWVHQHDWTLATEIPLRGMIDTMQAHEHNEELPIKYICLPSVRMLSYAEQSDVERFPQLKALTNALKQSFTPTSYPDQRMPLTPLFFWYDKPHLASVQHYIARVFPSRYATGRGDFIEDTIGRKARDQMKEGRWHKWACWLYYPGEGRTLCLRHLDGRRWRGVAGELKQKQMYLARMNPMTSIKQENGVDVADVDSVGESGDHPMKAAFLGA